MIRQLRSRAFRNLATATLDFEPGSTLLVGATGAGKTSLLEAVYLVLTTKSFRTAQLADCYRDSEEAAEQAEGFSVAAEVEDRRRVLLEIGWSRGGGLWRRLNQEAASLAEHLGVQPVLAWSSAEADTLVGPPASRRRLLDRGVVAGKPVSLALLSRYRRALEQKRRLLSDRRLGASGLAGWNELLAKSGCELLRERADYVERLRGALRETVARSGLELASVELSYRPSPERGLEGEEELLAALETASAEERAQRRALIGPHRDRFELLFRGRPVRHLASAGERKALGLLLLAAQARLLAAAGREPLLLLDDLDVELDLHTLGAVFTVLSEARQALITSNRPAAFERLEVGRQWEIREGRLEAVN